MKYLVNCIITIQSYKMNNYLKKGLQELNLIDDTSTQIRSLVWVRDKDAYKNKKDKYSPHIYIALEKANKYEVNGVYFRFFQDQRPPIPQIYIFDYTSDTRDEQDINKIHLTDLHKKLWNSLQVPLFYVFTKTEILIYNSYNQPKTIAGEIKYDLFKKIKIASQIERDIELKKYFSAKNFDNGSFWENEKYRNNFDVKKNVYEKLISKLKEIRQNLLKSNNVFNDQILNDNEKKSIIHKLLVMSILVKYLEEKKDLNGYSVFPKKNEKRAPVGHGKSIVYKKGFFEKYSQGQNSFVGLLENNGNLIELFRDLSKHFNGEIFKLTKNEELQLSKIKLDRFAEFFEAKTEKGGQGSFWRLYSFDDLPVELVSNIYEEFIEDKKSDGIVYTPPFLVNFLLEEVMPLNNNSTNFKILDPANGSGIFLVQAYKRLIYRWRRKNNWEPPKLEDLKDLLTNNIYGVDKNKEAVRLTAFSLTLALCDELSSLEIWDNLQFNKLKEKNLFESDFFELIIKEKLPTNFDLVIGNPPFVKKLSSSAQIIEKERVKNKLPKLPTSYSLSFLFLEQAMELIKHSGNICFLFPADAFLHKKESLKFTSYFFKENNVSSIVDFTPLRRVLFKSASVGTVALFYNNNSNKNKFVTHIIVRRTKSARNESFFEIDKYDFHKVNINEAIKTPFIWKTNLFNITERSREFIYELNRYPKLSNYLKEKTKEGIFTTKKNNNLYLIIKKNIFNHLLSTLLVNNSNQIDEFFQKEVYNIYTTNKNTYELQYLKNKIDGEKKLYKYFILNTSERAGISRSSSTILVSDIKNIPFTKKNIINNLSEIQRIILEDSINYLDDFFRLGENSIIHKIPSSEELDQFAKYYLMVLNSVYKTYKAAEPIQTSSNIIFPFYWGNKSKIPKKVNNEFERHLNHLLQKNYPEANLRFIRVMRIYDENVIYLIKPKQLRYWLRSVAIRDADETFAFLVNQEYNV